MNRRNFLSLSAIVPAVAALSACKPGSPESLSQYADDAVSHLLSQLEGNLDPKAPVLVATFVNIDDLESSSTFGRTAAELMSAALAQRGVNVADVRLRNALVTRPTGELMLTREAANLAKVHNAQAVLVGTYAVLADSRVVVTAKVIRIADNRVLAATSTEMTYAA